MFSHEHARKTLSTPLPDSRPDQDANASQDAFKRWRHDRSTAGIFFQKRLSRWMFQVPAQPIASMALFSPLDLPVAAVITRRKWWESIRWLHRYQRNLTVKSWSGIHTIYPRSLLWAYLHFLFGWAQYTGMLPQVLKQPDKSILAEMFIRYICEMDEYLDSFDSRDLLQTNHRTTRDMPKARAISAEFSGMLDRFGLSPSARYQVLRAVASYRREYFEAMRRNSMQRSSVQRSSVWHNTQVSDLRQVIYDKERVAGDLWHTWSRILGFAYGVPEAINQRAARFLFHLGMFIQVIDDIADAPVDFRHHTQNMFLSVVREIPDDWQRLEDFLNEKELTFIDWSWIQREIPASYKAIMRVFEGYGNALLEDSFNPSVTHDMHRAVSGILRLTY